MAACEDAQKDYDKLMKFEARQAEKLKDCGKEGYKGARRTLPVCVDGKPCEKCMAIWLDRHPPIMV
jgi:hypothetical protein